MLVHNSQKQFSPFDPKNSQNLTKNAPSGHSAYYAEDQKPVRSTERPEHPNPRVCVVVVVPEPDITDEAKLYPSGKTLVTNNELPCFKYSLAVCDVKYCL